jgi:sialate O-acetylesterase
MNHQISLIISLLLTPLASTFAADLKLAGVFTDHTVLQRDKPAPVWGWPNPGETITLRFGDQQKTGKADATGKWLIRLDSMPASNEGKVLSVESSVAGQKAEIQDVLVGDVWLCSGQSNMHFQLKSASKAKEEIAAANHPKLRFFTVNHQFAQAPCIDAAGDWKIISPATAADCSAVAYFFGVALQQKIDVPMGLLISSVGGTRIECWMRAETLAATGESQSLIKQWQNVSPAEFKEIGSIYQEFQRQRDQVHPQAVKAAKAQGLPTPPAPVAPKRRCHDCPSALHNGMIAPLEPFALRGAIWYQGESNAGQPLPYETLLPAMIADWRNVWGPDMPFLFVQLAPHRSLHPAFRESQQRIWQKTPHTAMVVTTDVGDAQNIHPTRKQPVGERLALAARALCYGEDIIYSGPVFKSMDIKDSRAVISFDHAANGLTATGGDLKGFTLAGADGKFLPAKAVIDGTTVILQSEKIPHPVAARYGWAMVPEVNLCNREGLPATPFRTDSAAEGKKPAVKSGKP